MKTLTNARRRTHWRYLGLLGATLSIPLAAVGFSVRPGLRWASAEAEIARLAEEVARLPEFGDLGALGEARDRIRRRAGAIEEVTVSLDGLLPWGCDLIELFDDVRRAARATDVELQAMSPGATTPVSADLLNAPVVPPEAPCVTELSLLGICEPQQLSRFVRNLRSGAHPTEVRAVNLSRENDSSKRFRFQLTLGLLHRGARSSGRGEQP